VRQDAWFALFLLVVGASTVSSQDAVEIKIHTRKVGDRVKVTEEEKTEIKMRIIVGENEAPRVEKKGCSLEYVEEVLEVAKGKETPTKLKRIYETAATSKDGKTTALSIQGKSVLIEKSGEKYTFAIDGKAVEGEAREILNREFNEPRGLITPNKPVKPGETWKLDANQFGLNLGKRDSFQLDTTKLESVGKLVKAYQTDGKQFGVFEAKLSAPITALDSQNDLKVKEGRLTATMTIDTCIDGTSPQVKSTGMVALTFRNPNQGFDVFVEVRGTTVRTTEVVKK